MIDLPVADSRNPSVNPLTVYLARLAPSSQLTMRYVLQDAADRLGFEDIDIEEIPWHNLQPEDVIALVATLREDGYAPNTSSLYVNAVRGVMNEAWRMSLISQEHLLKMRSVKGIAGTRLSQGRNLRRSLIQELMAVTNRSDQPPDGVHCRRAHRNWPWSGCCCGGPVSVQSTNRALRSPG